MFYSLTPRRLETLATLRRLTEEAGSAVHYSLVGARMRISAWTAYDLLLELEKLGLVVRRYVQDGAPTHGGRSRILFAPSAAPAASSCRFSAPPRAAFERFPAMRDETPAAPADPAPPSTAPTPVTLTTVHRTPQQRLVSTATSVDPTVASMVLQPYLTETGTTFDPATLGAAGLTVSLIAPGTFTVTAVGAPAPACNLGGPYATPCAQTPLTLNSVHAAGSVIVSSPAPALTTPPPPRTPTCTRPHRPARPRRP